MTLLGQSRKEDQKPTASIVNPRNKTRIGNWNVRTMFETGRAGQVAREMKRYKLDILGISECRWRGSGKSKRNTGEVKKAENSKEYFTLNEATRANLQAKKRIPKWWPFSDKVSSIFV